jgi:hypothetical protein
VPATTRVGAVTSSDGPSAAARGVATGDIASTASASVIVSLLIHFISLSSNAF